MKFTLKGKHVPTPLWARRETCIRELRDWARKYERFGSIAIDPSKSISYSLETVVSSAKAIFGLAKPIKAAAREFGVKDKQAVGKWAAAYREGEQVGKATAEDSQNAETHLPLPPLTRRQGRDERRADGEDKIHLRVVEAPLRGEARRGLAEGVRDKGKQREGQQAHEEGGLEAVEAEKAPFLVQGRRGESPAEAA